MILCHKYYGYKSVLYCPHVRLSGHDKRFPETECCEPVSSQYNLRQGKSRRKAKICWFSENLKALRWMKIQGLDNWIWWIYTPAVVLHEMKLDKSRHRNFLSLEEKFLNEFIRKVESFLLHVGLVWLLIAKLFFIHSYVLLLYCWWKTTQALQASSGNKHWCVALGKP